MGDWPLVGRGAELERLEASLTSGGRGLVVAGAPGVGKTRLAVECLSRAATRGYATIRVAATEGTARVPLGAFAVLIPELERGIDRLEMLRQVAGAVENAGQGEPVALLVDDAHLLDEMAAAVVYQLAATRKAFIVATVRSGTTLPDSVLALWKDGLTDRLDLEALSEAQLEELLASVLGGPVDAGARHLLFQRSAGNVLYLKELVLAARDSHALRNEGGLWRIPGRLPASARLVELVESRLSGLREADRRALEVLAVGEPLGVELFEDVAGRDPLATLEQHQLVRIERQHRRFEARLAHPLYGEVLRTLLPPLRTRDVCRALADALESSGARRRDDLLRLATWRLDGGGTVQSGTMLTAAERAWTLHDLALARRFALAAVEVGGGFEAELLLAQVMSLTGDGEEAEQRLAALFSRAGTDADRGRVAIARLDNLCYSLGRLDAGLAVAEEASRTIGDPAWIDEVTAYRASLLDAGGRTAQSLTVAAPLLDRATGRTLIWACVLGGYGYARTGQIARAIDTAQRGREAHLANRDRTMPFNPSIHVAVRCFALNFAGRLAEAEQLALEEYSQAMSGGSEETRWTMGVVLAPNYLAQGRVGTAVRWARETAALTRAHGRLVFLRAALISLAEAQALAGSPDEADRTIAELQALPMPSVQMWMVDALRAAAWAAAVRSHTAEARTRLVEAAAAAAEAGDRVCESASLHDLARLGSAAEVIPRLEELAGAIEGPLASARANHARALAARDPLALADISGTFEEVGGLLLAAEAAAEAAVAWKRAGNARDATAAERRARDLAGRCEGARTPALVATTAARTVLTARELEVARLAAAGRTNKEIAEALFLSAKYVENKLYDCYAKLGLKGRGELARALESFTDPEVPDHIVGRASS